MFDKRVFLLTIVHYQKQIFSPAANTTAMDNHYNPWTLGQDKKRKPVRIQYIYFHIEYSESTQKRMVLSVPSFRIAKTRIPYNIMPVIKIFTKCVRFYHHQITKFTNRIGIYTVSVILQ